MIKVDTSDFVPIYEQIKEQIKREIFSGNLMPDDLLPSIRDLALNLLINPNTVARAYRELEMEGFIYTRKGRGCYVSDNSKQNQKEERKNILVNIFDEAIEDAKRLGFSPEEIERLLEERLALGGEDTQEGEKNE